MLTLIVCLVLALSFSLAVALLIQRLEGGSEQDS
jgi:preprotein translocase subunit SecG